MKTEPLHYTEMPQRLDAHGWLFGPFSEVQLRQTWVQQRMLVFRGVTSPPGGHWQWLFALCVGWGAGMGLASNGQKTAGCR